MYQLVELHLAAGRFVQAGLTLVHHAKQHDLNDSILPAFEELSLPSQTSSARREMLMLLALDYFEKGQQWEIGVATCEGLAEEHRHKTFVRSKIRFG